MAKKVNTKLSLYLHLASRGTAKDIDLIMQDLTNKVILEDSKFIDYALGQVSSIEGIERLTHYLYHGTQIQRNYCALFFSRRDDWDKVNKAYKMGCIDVIQAYAR